MAISKTGDPLSGGWYVFEFNVGSFPFKFGVWPDAYCMAANFGTQVTAVAFERAQMLNGQPAGMVQFNVAGLPGLGGNMMLPSDLDGSTPPPPGALNYFYRQVDGDHFGGADRLEIWEFHVNWVSPANSTFSGPTNLPMAPFDSALCGFFSFQCVPQPGTTVKLDPINEWPMWRLQYRNIGTHETLLGNFAVDVNGLDRAGIRWFELRKLAGDDWSIFHEGTFAPNTPGGEHRWLGSIAMDRDGNVALRYSASSSTVFPSIRYTGRLASDPLGLLPQGEETLVSGGSSSPSVRWGDYSSMNVDPVDDCTFWYTNEYIPAGTSEWRTRIGAFRFASCAGPPGSQPDLVATAVSNPPSAAQVGESFPVTDTVENQGDAAAGNSTTRYYLSSDMAKGAGDKRLTGARAVDGLGPGATSTGTKTVGIPAGTAAGEYFLLAC